MRIVDSIPHPAMKISIFQWNGKYIIKYELGNYEQAFKISEMDVTGIGQIKQLFNETFNNQVYQRFAHMHEDYKQLYSNL